MTPTGTSSASAAFELDQHPMSTAVERLPLRPGLPAHIFDRAARDQRVLRRGRFLRRVLILADVVALLAAFAAVEGYAVLPAGNHTLVDRAAIFAVVALGALVVMALHGLYGQDELRADHTTTDDLAPLLHSVVGTAFGAILVLELTSDAPVQAILVGATAAAVCLPAFRALARMYARRRPAYIQRTLILGAGDIGQLMARKLLTHPEYGQTVVGFVDDNPRPLGGDVADVPILGSPLDVPRLVRQHGIERVIVAFTGRSHVAELDTIRMLKDLNLQVDIVPRLFEVLGPNTDINVFEGLPVLALPPLRLSRRRLAVKRTIDVVVSGLGIVAALPLFAAIAIAIRLDGRGPLLYRGRRIGPRGRVFSQLKFRSMDYRYCRMEGQLEFEQMLAENPEMAAEFALTQKLTDDPRVTRVGRFLRRTSLDELPQLFNVLRGDLSLVGPRPITETEMRERYRPRILDPFTHETLLVGYWDSPGLRPGLTGYWQISGRSTMSFDERIRLDTAYLTSWSLGLDLAILAKTARALFATRGAY